MSGEVSDVLEDPRFLKRYGEVRCLHGEWSPSEHQNHEHQNHEHQNHEHEHVELS